MSQKRKHDEKLHTKFTTQDGEIHTKFTTDMKKFTTQDEKVHDLDGNIHQKKMEKSQRAKKQ